MIDSTMRRRQQQQRTRRRKQPKMRRVQAITAVPIPRVSVPKTAKRRQRRNNRRVRLPTTALKRFLFSARWISLGLLVLTVYALVQIGLEERFYLTLIPVEGTVSIPAEEIVAASDLAGSHIFAADPNQAAAQIDELPGVISATVTLRWPNQVLIGIKEDTPVAVWQEGEKQYWINGDGRLLPARIEALGLLRIEAERPSTAAEEPVALDEEAGEAAGGDGAEVTDEPQVSLPFIPEDVLDGALQLKRLRPNIDKLYYRPSGGLSYQDGRGWRVYFGSGIDMEQKLVVYETIVEHLLAEGRQPVYISVSNQEKPYYLAQ